MKAATPRSKTAPSTRPPSSRPSNQPRLSAYARAFVFPADIERTVWTRVEAKGREVGIGFDWWQSQLGTVCLGYRKDGKYAATVGGIGMSIPRQVGKTYFVLAMIVLLCLLFPGLQVVWTAHHLRTTTKTFTALRGIVRRKKIKPLLKPSRNDGIRSANGEQEVEFANGSKIMFGARKMGFGRGFDEIDVMVFDEAQILDTKSLEDMIAATNQARHEHGGLLFFMGTPPREGDPSEAFTLRRKEALAGDSEDSIWLEIGADPDSDPNDESQWPLMNPSYPLRTSREALLRLRKNLGNVDSWNREGRGIWDPSRGLGLFGADAWDSRALPVPEDRTTVGLAVACAYDMKFTALVSVATSGDDGIVHARPVFHAPGTAGVVAAAKAAQAQTDLPVVIDPKSPAKPLIPLLEEAGVKVRLASFDDLKDACSGIAQRVKTGTLGHDHYAELDASVATTPRRNVGDRWVIDRVHAPDSAPLEGLILATWAADHPEAKAEPNIRMLGV